MSDRWCDDCAWPEACADEACCRRREAGEIRSAAPSETAAKIARAALVWPAQAPALHRHFGPREVTQ